MKLKFAGSGFQASFDDLVPTLDSTSLQAPDPRLLPLARSVWTHRFQTEFRSIQVMTRFLEELLGAGDPLDVFPSAAEAILDEIRHTALMAKVVEMLGGEVPDLPDPVREPLAPEYLELPMVQRALITAISVAINETISIALITDLHSRCTNPPIRAVLSATIADEDGHGDLGWAYVAASLQRFDAESQPFWRAVAHNAYQPHRDNAARVVGSIPIERRTTDAWTEPELAMLGLMSAEREALLFERTWTTSLQPRLKQLRLL